MTFQEAIAERDWLTVTGMVAEYTTELTTDEHGADELQDWLSAGDWHGGETPQSVAAEWDALCRTAREL